MSAPKPALAEFEFWFDFSSPYAYFSALEVDEIGRSSGKGVVWRPFLLGAIYQVTGMKPLTDIPMRGEYSRRDWARLARRRGVSFQMPESYPKLVVQPARAFYALEAQDAALANRFAKAVFIRSFGEGQDASTLEAVTAILRDLDVDPAPILAAIASSEGKEELRRRCDEAMAKGVFGSPFFLARGEPFWGSDRLKEAEEWLTGDGW